MVLTSAPDLIERLSEIQELPTLPKIAVEVSEVISDPLFSMEDLEKVILQDPALSTKVLRVANSAYYCFRIPITTIRRALTILGLKGIQQIVLSISVIKAFEPRLGQATFDREAFWQHSASTGAVTFAFSEKLKTLDNRALRSASEAAFISGLLHDLGKIVLDTYFHEDFEKVLSLVATEKLPMIEAERNVFGADHAIVGGWIAKHWRLPENVISAIRYHHEPENSQDHHILVCCVHLGDLFCKVGGTGFGNEPIIIKFLSLPAWRALVAIFPQLKFIDMERFTFELEEEFEKSRELLAIFRGRH
ncbi:MAG: HDOD domain-containing protein [bacterium]